MKALVTGATGFIGGNLVRELLKQGYQVRALVRNESNRRNIQGEVHDAKDERAEAQNHFDQALKLYYENHAQAYLEEIVAIMEKGRYTINPEYVKP